MGVHPGPYTYRELYLTGMERLRHDFLLIGHSVSQIIGMFVDKGKTPPTAIDFVPSTMRYATDPKPESYNPGSGGKVRMKLNPQNFTILSSVAPKVKSVAHQLSKQTDSRRPG